MTLFTDGRLQTYERMMQQVDYNTPSCGRGSGKKTEHPAEEKTRKGGDVHGSDQSKEE